MVSDSARTIAATIIVAIVLAATTPLFVGATSASATVVLTLHNSNDHSAIHYRIYINGEQGLEGDIGAQGTVIKTIVIPFPSGIRTFYHVNIGATIDSSDLFAGALVSLNNGQSFPIALNLH